jgi:membrane fusion protein (multidrug efflux system)
VSGVIQNRFFQEGSDVEAGDLLFQIDPRPYQIAVDQARSNLGVANAVLLKAKSQYDRVATLGKLQVVSELDEISARANFDQAKAEVASAEAALKSAQIDLDYAAVKAPISGRIGRSLVTEGALVRANEATHLATIQQIDPIYASFSQSAGEALNLRNAYENKNLTINPKDNSIPVQLRLEDGSQYDHTGRLLFGEVTVERSTGQVNFRAMIPNSKGMLLPGMYVRVLVEQGNYANAFLVPQQAVKRSEMGDQLWVLDTENKPVLRDVQVIGSKNNQWIVIDGLDEGDLVVISGFFKLQSGVPVSPLIKEKITHDKPDMEN